jgi:hypothetical protein
LHQHRGDGTATAIELRLDDRAFRGPVRIGAELQDFRLKLQAFEQGLEPFARFRRYLKLEGVATHGLDHDLVAEQLGANTLRVGVRLVDLVDRHDQRHLRGLRVRNRLDRLRHDAVIGRHHEHHDVRHLGATGTHRREGRVAGGVDESDLAAER